MVENRIDASDYCFVLMPNVAPQTNIQPATGLGLLSAYLQQAGYRGQVVYANLIFMKELRLELTEHISDNIQNFLGDWLFAHVLFPETDTEEKYNAYMQALMAEVPGYYFFGEDALKKKLIEARRQVTKYLEELVDQVIASNPRMVGCGVTFSQHVPTLAFMKRLREKAPSIVTVLGGPNCETVLGATTHREFPWIDYVVSGEGDDLIVPLMSHVQKNRGSIPAALAPRGLFVPEHRQVGYPPLEDWLAMRENLENLPLPDYDDFFREIARLPGLEQSYVTMLPFEASRGCWWAQKKGCSFCSVNKVTSKYRVRPANQILQQITDLSAKYGLKNFFAVDSIIDNSHIKLLMPQLAKEDPKFGLFFEVTARLAKGDLQAIVDAGASWVQPGIESLHSEALQLMNKGTEAWQNVQFLKYARELGLYVTWLLLYGFPGEKDEWYDEMADFMPQLIHLPPPAFLNPILFLRNSTYFNEQERYGLNLQPFPITRYILPLKPEVLADLSYLFKNEGADGHRGMKDGKYQSPPGWERVNKEVKNWNAVYYSTEHPVLVMTDDLVCLEITDTRPVAVQRQHVLTGLTRQIYLACDAAPQEEVLFHQLADEGVARREGEDSVSALVEAKLLLRLDGRLLTLAVSAAPPVPSIFVRAAMEGMAAWGKEYDRIQRKKCQDRVESMSIEGEE